MIRAALVSVSLAALLLAGCATAAQDIQVANEVCAVLQADGPIFIALADANGVPIPATGRAATAIAADCAVVGAVAASVPPPGAQVQTVILPVKPAS